MIQMPCESGFDAASMRHAARWLAGLTVLTLAIPSAGDESMASDFSFSCTAAPEVSEAQADLVCGEFADFLRSSFPDRVVRSADGDHPRIDLTVLKSSERTVSLDVTFVDVEGRQTRGTQLQTAFFDRNADPEMRKLFFVKFLNQNPIPF
jgi:hypothetical protein